MSQVLGLENFKEKRNEWIQEDFTEHFPFQCLTGKDSSFSHIILSFRPHFSTIRIGYLSFGKDPTTLDVDERVQSCLAPFAWSHLNGSELAISASLTMLAHGQIGLKDLFGKGQGNLYSKCDFLRDMRLK